MSPAPSPTQLEFYREIMVIAMLADRYELPWNVWKFDPKEPGSHLFFSIVEEAAHDSSRDRLLVDLSVITRGIETVRQAIRTPNSLDPEDLGQLLSPVTGEPLNIHPDLALKILAAHHHGATSALNETITRAIVCVGLYGYNKFLIKETAD